MSEELSTCLFCGAANRPTSPELTELKAAWADVWTATNDQAAAQKLNRLADAIKRVCEGRTE